jgi:hypothetical protein
MRVNNVDEFLYIKRCHAESLTLRPDTALGCATREQLAAQWKHDLRQILNKDLDLHRSNLAPKLRSEPFWYSFV